MCVCVCLRVFAFACERVWECVCGLQCSVVECSVVDGE